MSNYINHITMTTGHNNKSPRSDVTDGTLSILHPWLVKAIEAGTPVPLPVDELSHFSAQIVMEFDSPIVTIFGPLGPHKEGKPHSGKVLPLVTFGIAQAEKHATIWQKLEETFGAASGIKKPPEPWCAVVVHPSITTYKDSVAWIGDFERCVAWAWITRNPDLSIIK